MKQRPEAAVAARAAVAVAAVTVAVGTWVLAAGAARFTTYAGRSWLGAALTVSALASLTIAGVCGAGARRGAVISALPILAGVVWVAPVWVGWHGGPPLVRSVGFACAGLLVAVVVHTCLRAVGGRSASRGEAVLVAGAYGVALVSALVLALTRDPYLDPGCLSNCDVNVFLISAHPTVANTFQQVDRWFATAVAIGAVAVIARRAAAASRLRRRRLLPIAIPLLLFTAVTAARTALLQTMGVEDPYDNRLFVTFVLTACALVLLGAGLLADAARRRGERHAIAATVMDLGDTPAPGSLRLALAQALEDPDLSIAYWLPERHAWVDADGRQIDEPTAAPGGRLTRLTRDGEQIAVVRHGAPLPDLAEALGAAFLLGLENERLQAGVLAHLDEIRASRSRIVETGDAERRRLERDLHDGAQQRLLALSYDLRLAYAAAAPGSAAEPLLADAVEGSKRALADLRELAHGIYPATLPDIGLASALESLAESAPLPVEVSATAPRRWIAAVESTAYFAAVEAVDDAYRRGASYIELRIDGDDDLAILETADDGSDMQGAPIVLIDRVVASGGRVLSGERGFRVELPCG